MTLYKDLIEKKPNYTTIQLYKYHKVEFSIKVNKIKVTQKFKN